MQLFVLWYHCDTYIIHLQRPEQHTDVESTFIWDLIIVFGIQRSLERQKFTCNIKETNVIYRTDIKLCI